MAILAIIPTGIISIIDIGNHANRMPPSASPTVHALAILCAVWLALVGFAEGSRRWRRDPCLDVISWLLPESLVFEIGGVHIRIFGWLTSGKEPVLRVVVLTQNCHRGERTLTLTLTPRTPEALERPGPVELQIPLSDAAVRCHFESRRLLLRQGALEFDLKGRVRIGKWGPRVRLRRGTSPRSRWLEPAKMLIAAQNPAFLAVHLATSRGNIDQAPVILAAQEAPEPCAWPGEALQSVWDPGLGWTTSGVVTGWIAAMSGRFSEALRRGTPLPMTDGEGL